MKTNNIEKFVVLDNSCQQCLDDNGKNHYLAGTMLDEKTEDQRTVLVLIQPFWMNVPNIMSRGTRCLPFIIGLGKDGLRHLILYTPMLNF